MNIFCLLMWERKIKRGRARTEFRRRAGRGRRGDSDPHRKKLADERFESPIKLHCIKPDIPRNDNHAGWQPVDCVHVRIVFIFNQRRLETSQHCSFLLHALSRHKCSFSPLLESCSCIVSEHLNIFKAVQLHKI